MRSSSSTLWRSFILTLSSSAFDDVATILFLIVSSKALHRHWINTALFSASSPHDSDFLPQLSLNFLSQTLTIMASLRTISSSPLNIKRSANRETKLTSVRKTWGGWCAIASLTFWCFVVLWNTPYYASFPTTSLCSLLQSLLPLIWAGLGKTDIPIFGE